MVNRRKPVAAVRRISIENYKGIDSLELELPAPRMKSDPDVIVIGSQNGIGKTSILECCALLLSTLTTGEMKSLLGDKTRMQPLDLPDFLIRAGLPKLEVRGEVSLEKSNYDLNFTLSRRGTVSVRGTMIDRAREHYSASEDENMLLSAQLASVISGFSADPVVTESFLLFHSYRKVQEGNLDLGSMAEDMAIRSLRRRAHMDFSPSLFKMTVVRSLMQKADLFEITPDVSADDAIDRLNSLLELYAGGTIGKLRLRADNSVDFRIEPSNGGKSFTFDGLGSGQKEIISTLFLVWYHTQERPAVILIKEPELHLNVQWQRSFLRTLFELAPSNQYIVATHSVDVMDSVEEDRRVLLSN